MISLKNHPFAVDAHFDFSLVLTFAVPKQELENLIPPCLQLDTFDDKYAFIAAAFVQTKYLRPRGFNKILGRNFFLIGYRVFVRYKTSGEKKLRGLYILKSETNKKSMQFFGNLFTHYQYSTNNISISKSDRLIAIESNESNPKVVVDYSNENVALPSDSVFEDWKQARRFAGPLPHTFTFNNKTNEVLIIEGVRENWTPKPIKVVEYNLPFIDGLKLNNCVLANAFMVEDIPYSWKKGKIDLWKQ